MSFSRRDFLTAAASGAGLAAVHADERPAVDLDKRALIAITLDLYSHVIPGMQAEAAEKLGAMILGTR